MLITSTISTNRYDLKMNIGYLNYRKSSVYTRKMVDATTYKKNYG